MLHSWLSPREQANLAMDCQGHARALRAALTKNKHFSEYALVHSEN